MRHPAQRLAVMALAALALAAVLPAGLARADGIYFGRRLAVEHVADLPPTTSAQQAYLVHFDGWETLGLQSNYRGPKADFAWVIPVPSRPEVTKGDSAALARLEERTRPAIISSIGGAGGGISLGCSAAPSAEQISTALGVTILESTVVGDLDVVVLQAAGADGLMAWLDINAYHVPASARPVLDRYIQRSFYFVVTRFTGEAIWAQTAQQNAAAPATTPAASPAAVPAQTPAASARADGAVEIAPEEYRRAPAVAPAPGSPAPVAPAAPGAVAESSGTIIQLRFRCDKPWFPLAISAPEAAPDTDILIFAVARRRLQPANYPSKELAKLPGLRDAVGNWRPVPGGDDQRRRTSSEALANLIHTDMPDGFVIEAAVPAFVEFDRDGRVVPASLRGYEGQHLARAFVTRLHAVMGPEAMKEDLVLADAPRDDRYDPAIHLSNVMQPPRSGRPAGPALAAVALAVGILPLGFRTARRSPGHRSRTAWLRRVAVIAALALLALA